MICETCKYAIPVDELDGEELTKATLSFYLQEEFVCTYKGARALTNSTTDGFHCTRYKKK